MRRGVMACCRAKTWSQERTAAASKKKRDEEREKEEKKETRARLALCAGAQRKRVMKILRRMNFIGPTAWTRDGPRSRHPGHPEANLAFNLSCALLIT